MLCEDILFSTAFVRIYFEHWASATKKRMIPTADTQSGELYYRELREGGECSYQVATGFECGLKIVGYKYEPPRARRESGSALSCSLSLK